MLILTRSSLTMENVSKLKQCNILLLLSVCYSNTICILSHVVEREQEREREIIIFFIYISYIEQDVDVLALDMLSVTEKIHCSSR